MRARTFLLLKDPPDPDPEVHTASLAEPSDGVFILHGFPSSVRFGVFIELAVAPHEAGQFDVTLLLSSIRLPLDLETYPPEAFDPIETKAFMKPLASDAWTMPRTHWLSMDVELTVPDEVDVLLWLALDDGLAAGRPLLFRTPPTIPPAL